MQMNAILDSFGVKIEDATVEQVLCFGTADIGKPYLDCITAVARAYVSDIFATLRRYEYNPDLMRLYIVGGGSCLVRNFGSHAERGLDEQPTIHEGVTAQALEGKGIISDRCELNRQIKADNLFLKELKAQVRKLTEAVANTIPAIAERLEDIQAHMIKLQYHLLHNRAEIKDISGRVDWNLPLIKEYQSVKEKLKEKQAEKKSLVTEKNNTSIFNPAKHIQLNKRISTLTEEIEELKTRKNQLMYEVGCQSDAEIKEAEKKLSKMTDYLEKMRAQQPKLTSQLEADEKSFTEAREKISPQQEDALLDARVSFRDDFRNQIRAKLREVFGQKFQYDRLSSAEEQIDRRLGEDSDLFWKRAAKLCHEQEMERRRNQPNRPKKKSRNYEL